MKTAWKAVAAAFFTASAVTLAGVLFFFQPIKESDTSSATVAAPLAFLVYVALCVALFHWMALQMKSAGKAAFALAAAQFVLAADLALRGERGLATLAASGVLLAVTWSCVAFAYALAGGQRQR